MAEIAATGEATGAGRATPSFAPVARPRRLPDEVAKALIAEIERGTLRPGDRLPTEAALSQQFGVARTVVREAVSLLRFDGIIESRRGVGAFVADPERRASFRISPACFAKRRQIVQLLQLRTEVQAGASALAAEARSADDMAEIRALFEAMEAADRAGPGTALEARVEAELALYRRISMASGNSYFTEVVQMIELNIQTHLRSAFLKNAAACEFGPAIMDEHRAVLLALEAGDAVAARAATQARFDAAAGRLAARGDFA